MRYRRHKSDGPGKRLDRVNGENVALPAHRMRRYFGRNANPRMVLADEELSAAPKRKLHHRPSKQAPVGKFPGNQRYGKLTSIRVLAAAA